MADEASTASSLSAVPIAPPQEHEKHHENNEEDEWEYEYHEDEFDDFYVTLDLTGVATASKPKGKERGAPRSDKESDAIDGDDTEEKTQLQIMELHGQNPIISYGGKVFSCRWASALGTDLYFSNVVDTFEMNEDPLKAGKKFDLLGAGSARLVATSVELKKRSAGGEDEVEGILTNGLSGRPGWDASGGKQSQIRFINRLEAVKRKKNETDRIPLSAFRPNRVFSQRYRTQYTPSDDEDDAIDSRSQHNSPTEGTALQDHVVKSKPNMRRRNRPERSLHGDITKMRDEFEEEMRKHTPIPRDAYTRPGESMPPSVTGPSNAPKDPADDTIVTGTEDALYSHEPAPETDASSDASLSSDTSTTEDDSESDSDDEDDLYEDDTEMIDAE
ncbi:hypothetical protein EJ05DRAFT_509656 [Pseudovirgaria hyperparasitica]|uniref:Transcription factor TFIIIC triple barrel domain-containing protein n=1 Tax=Pseudovirgaria hyperparasitica TaxID=470096 RepID=A0A6A6WAV6_9PEZI|nr:uncharacterized protein EJ05DRAFT_509656 [Pseudovirgaria hyperparasitica]KAF2759988.1 hypothetical protein EJ05DRAFT_509656 [Pseudovirgaria hyperparasitica]